MTKSLLLRVSMLYLAPALTEWCYSEELELKCFMVFTQCWVSLSRTLVVFVPKCSMNQTGLKPRTWLGHVWTCGGSYCRSANSVVHRCYRYFPPPRAELENKIISTL